MAERLQKIIAAAGICSRRKAEELIKEGRVTVNGLKVTEMGIRIDMQSQVVAVDGKPLEFGAFVYLLMNKPHNMLTTLSDPRGRPTIVDLLRGMKDRVYPVGRLDFDSEGLLLLTNHGELTNRLLHPSYKTSKTYSVKVEGFPTVAKLTEIRTGVKCKGFRAHPAEVRVTKKNRTSSWLEFVLKEGRKHQVKLMCEAIGHPIRRLIRTRISFLSVEGLKPGQVRPLNHGEVTRLLQEAGL
ncbi:MAG: pseudouridine synthase [Candidatus Wallbacteria bacterium]|nr:pseudouridine synthase [Candidatus Wallbacteria bacterium]